MYKVDEHILAAASGLIPDAVYLLDSARLHAQRFLYAYRESIPVEQLVQSVCASKHEVTQYGSYRPYGVQFMFAGYDQVNGFQLYGSDPSGNYAAWKAQATGKNTQNATSILKQEYDDKMKLRDALSLAVRVLTKTMDTPNPSPDKCKLNPLVDCSCFS